jgi:hypothetical protein
LSSSGTFANDSSHSTSFPRGRKTRAERLASGAGAALLIRDGVHRRGEPGRQHEAGAADAVLRPRDRRIDGEHERLAAGAFRSRNDLAREAAVALQVDLKPERCGRRGGDLLDGHRGAAADHEDRLRVRGAARGLGLALRMQELVIRGRREEDRVRQLLAEERAARAQARDVGQDVRAQLVRVERLRVPAQRHFVGGAGGDVLVRHRGEALSRGALVVVEGEQLLWRSRFGARVGGCGRRGGGRDRRGHERAAAHGHGAECNGERGGLEARPTFIH